MYRDIGKCTLLSYKAWEIVLINTGTATAASYLPQND